MNMVVGRSYRFEAAHRLPWHPGKCAALHGHSYRLEVCVSGSIDAQGMVMDFADLDEVVENLVVRQLDHRNLNELLANPTAELLAGWIAQQLEGLAWSTIRLWETDRGWVEVVR
jgi:6-pyruvoyltetrahydropterin/6-carboxytetrahydropterin synthase